MNQAHMLYTCIHAWIFKTITIKREWERTAKYQWHYSQTSSVNRIMSYPYLDNILETTTKLSHKTWKPDYNTISSTFYLLHFSPLHRRTSYVYINLHINTHLNLKIYLIYIPTNVECTGWIYGDQSRERCPRIDE